MSVRKKKEIDNIIFETAFHFHYVGVIVENQLKEQMKKISNLKTTYPDLLRAAIFKAVKAASQHWGKNQAEFSSHSGIIVKRCDEQLNRLANRLYSSKRDTVAYLARNGFLGPVKDGWKYTIGWFPIFNAHQHFHQWHSLLKKSQATKLLTTLRKSKFSHSIIEKIVWDNSLTHDLLQIIDKMTEREIVDLIDTIISVKFLGKQMIWSYILAGKILLGISKNFEDSATIKKVATGLFKHKGLHSCSKILVQLTGIKDDYYSYELYDENSSEIEPERSDEFWHEIYRPKFWKDILNMKECKRNEIPVDIMDVYENAAEPLFDLVDDDLCIDFGFLADYEQVLLSYKEYSVKTLKKQLESATKTYLDWHNSPASQRQALDEIITLCNNHKYATTIPITLANKQKPLIEWINKFMEASPVPPHPHERTNEELIVDTTQELELLQRLDRYERYYNQVFKEYS
jgi:hypothetical protein